MLNNRTQQEENRRLNFKREFKSGKKKLAILRQFWQES